MKESRVKGDYIIHKTIRGSIGVKVVALGLEKAVAGSEVVKVGSMQEAEEIADKMKSELAKLLTKYINNKGEGVLVQSNTLGSLEAILNYLEKQKI